MVSELNPSRPPPRKTSSLSAPRRPGATCEESVTCTTQDHTQDEKEWREGAIVRQGRTVRALGGIRVVGTEEMQSCDCLAMLGAAIAQQDSQHRSAGDERARRDWVMHIPPLMHVNEQMKATGAF